MLTVAHVLELKDAHVTAVQKTATVREAVGLMSNAQVGCVVVEDEDGALVGIFSERDLVRRVVDVGLDPDTTPISEVMSWPVTGCSPQDSLHDCAELLDSLQVRHLPVLEDDKVVGLISASDVLAVDSDGPDHT